mmetsp:Transcript_49332/g.99320  ORF Transcript_49332/g.99320 Transcript_49332/m.99320 type:complete len:91 (+) Transcript_49332:31-303(+)
MQAPASDWMPRMKNGSAASEAHTTHKETMYWSLPKKKAALALSMETTAKKSVSRPQCEGGHVLDKEPLHPGGCLADPSAPASAPPSASAA